MRWGKWKMWKVNKTDLTEQDLTIGGRRLPEVEHPGDSPLGQLTVLYDLSEDVGESQNLAAQHPEIVERLETELERWNAELAEPMWLSNRSTIYDLHGQMIQVFF